VIRHTLPQSLVRLAAAALAAVGISCNSPTNPGPIDTALAIQSVTPSIGPAAGGTEVIIRGTGFGAAATLSIGGRPATNVNVSGTDVIAARTPASTIAGPVDVVVTLNGRTSSLTGGFRYEPALPNTAPVIRSFTAQGRRLRQPAAFADYGETIQLTLVIEDAESTAAQLTYQWRACDGTFSGTGPQVDWTAPAGGTLPSTCTIEVTITDGPHVATRSIVIRLHNSIAEVSALALEFLTEFANSTIPAETTVRNFSEATTDCSAGKAAELKEVQDNRTTRKINSHVYGLTTATINFGGVCAFRSRAGDACVVTPVEWQSTIIPSGLPETAKGISQITGVYENGNSRWRLCRSELQQPSTTSGLRFMY
jgi:IPT/TIG domain